VTAIGEPVSLPTLREGIDELERLVRCSSVAGKPLIVIEATGSLHRAWTAELERRFPGCVRLLAPSETQAASTQLGARRFKSDDRDCAALVWLARQGLGRQPDEPALEALLGAVRHRRQLVSELKVLRQRLHDQPRLDDLGYALWKHLNLGLIDLPLPEQARRTQLMVSAYGIPARSAML
jgi:transposase